ncbi:HD domain-containing protein [Nocardia sp. 004]|uniref:HD domain-containing protein n=1 Tax=Nocardia sp. 004 TaxID=3385978 RepID=UPI0039A22FA8
MIPNGTHPAAQLSDVEMIVPDTRLAREAEQEARARLSTSMLEHSYRTYFFGQALATLDGVQVDEELSWTAAMLHDIELEHPAQGRCFAVRGAEHAEQFMTSLGEPPQRVVLVRDGIAGHITLGVESDLSDIAGFLAAGAGADLVGARCQDIDPDWMGSVIESHPRLQFKQVVIAAVRAETAAVPGGRLAVTHAAGLELMINAAPFNE